ncbi:MAG: hypothetical protein R3F65_26480 [bacterium]
MNKLIAAALAACALGACAPADDTGAPPEDPLIGQSGIELRADILADTDVAGMAYVITPVDCDTGQAIGDPITTHHDLEDLLLPGGHPGFEDQPFAADSTHLFADHFQALEPGCYDVTVQPLDADGDPSDDCAPASADGVEVVAEQVTEVLLISQCAGDALGGLDVIAVLNHAPEIVDLSYEPSKFTCGGETTICITATDPDGDPLTLVATAPDGVDLIPAAPVIGDDGTVRQCVTVETPAPGEYDVTLTVYDQMMGPDGRPVTIQSQLDDGQTSHATITAPVHAMDGEACLCVCPEGFTLDDAGERCEREVEAEAVFNGVELDVCEGDDLAQYGALGARFPGGLTVQNAFFGEDFVGFDGRLNDVGIWACRDGIEDEWIGFSFCLTVDEPGEYVIGTGGDDHTRITIDGNPIFQNAGQEAFRHWWMIPIQLGAGSHLIELEGYDTGVAASLGAEVYGPFPVGATVDDASMAALDYAGNIIWSTGDQLGGVFQTGDTSGYTCPDGTSLDLCGDVAICTGVDYAECQ